MNLLGEPSTSWFHTGRKNGHHKGKGHQQKKRDTKKEVPHGSNGTLKSNGWESRCELQQDNEHGALTGSCCGHGSRWSRQIPYKDRQEACEDLFNSEESKKSHSKVLWYDAVDTIAGGGVGFPCMHVDQWYCIAHVE